MKNTISLSFLSLLVGCAAKTAPVETVEPPAVEEAAPAEAPAPAPASSSTAAADVQWAPFNPEQPEGIQLAILQGNPSEGAFAALVKFPAGHASPVHSHPANFTGLTVSGTVQNGRSADDNVTMGAGTVWTQPANEVHYTGCTEDADCIVVAHMDGAMGMAPAEAPMEGEMQMTVTTAADMPFSPVNPEMPEGPQMFVASGDMATGSFRSVVQFPGGMASPEHHHSATYSGVVLSGSMAHGTPDALGAGSHWTQQGGEAHVTGCASEEPCLFFISMEGAFDMHVAAPPEAPAEAPVEAPAE
jgi:quercetin dioxygenase-like cupin family protein